MPGNRAGWRECSDSLPDGGHPATSARPARYGTDPGTSGSVQGVRVLNLSLTSPDLQLVPCRAGFNWMVPLRVAALAGSIIPAQGASDWRRNRFSQMVMAMR